MWIDFVQKIDDLPAALNAHLQLRTFLVGYAITLADVVVFTTLLPTWATVVEARGKTLPHVVRWFNFIESLPQVAEVFKTYAPKANSQVNKETPVSSAHY